MAVGVVVALLFLGVADNQVTRDARASTVVVDTSSSISVTATTTFSFTPNSVSNLPTGTSVSVVFTNGDSNLGIHTFTIIGCPNVYIPRAGTHAFDISRFINGTSCGAPLLNLVPAAEGTKTGSVSVATPGWYEFVCTESGHFQVGMYGFIGFGVIAPSNTSLTPGAGLAVFIIVGTIVTLTVIAIVLGFVVGKREGSKHEMPPERLGYGEPGSPPLPNSRSPPPPHP
ncbi:MAG: hypothetical protein WAK40_04540 [Thermoplasmata archaeon]